MEMDPPPPPPSLHTDRRRCHEYLLALEEERRKIQVFQRELPLCLDLVTQTIEAMRSHMDSVVDGCDEETVSDHGPVLEEFMPLKPSLSLSSSDSEEHETAAHEATTTTTDGVEKKKEEAAAETQDRRLLLPPPEAKKAMPDWLQSVQLWSPKPQQQPPSPEKPHQEVLPHKPVALNATRAWGAFQPFEKVAKRAEPPASSSTTAAASSAVVGDSCDVGATDTDTAERSDDGKETSKHAASDKGKGGSKDKEAGQSSEAPNRKPRRCWAPELHRRFLKALQQLGGSHVATPKQIRELMKVEGLTNDEVKSHLQKYRLHTRRPNSTTVQSRSTSATPPVPQFVVVGGIWMPPPEYAAMAAAAAAAAAAAQPQAHLAGDASGTANKVYAPVVPTLPSGRQHTNSQQDQRQSSRCSEGRRSGDASSGSPAVSSSSRTISA
ncbi:hypothetical protein U9M48_006809 [Paspalum notatum var. saurae]|uniref:HTH myb-type domain-containing protein n=1 Tax=Paspalum notatum var. saurae TaxID=547442 RepID=A0AAQ3PQD2_PASNO